MGPKDAAPPDVAAEPAVCPFASEPDCTPGSDGGGCPDAGHWVCVEDSAPATTSTCRLGCTTDDSCLACSRVCVPLSGGGGACLPGTGPGEPCNPETCNPGLDCISNSDADHAFCRTRCGPGMPCVEQHFFCYERRDPGDNHLLGYTCGPYFGTLLLGEDCSTSSDFCANELLCATHAGGTTCVTMCYPGLVPDGCTSGTCQPVHDEDGHGIGYGCL
jgi:hypothetical protein